MSLKPNDLTLGINQDISDEAKKPKKQELISKSEIVIGVLPGLGDYNSDTSSDEETDNSEDDAENSIINDNSVKSAVFNKNSGSGKSVVGKITDN